MITPVSEESLKRLEDVAKLMSPSNLNRDTTFAVLAEVRALRRVADAAERQTKRCDCTCADCMAVQRAIDALRDAGRLP